MTEFTGLGERLNQIRRSKKLTVRDVASDINVNFSYLSKLEKGANPSLPVLHSIAEYYKVDINYLLTGREEVKDDWIDLSRELKNKGLSPDNVRLIVESFYSIKNVVNKLK